MKNRLLFAGLLVVSGFLSCSPPPSNEAELVVEAMPRLTKYYPEVNAQGDTTWFTVPTDRFINQHGDTFATDVLRGKISVTQFFFTSCEGICPVISGNMFTVQKAFAGNQDVKLVSYSVDPARDSVSALKKYSTRFNCDSAQWTLLTGDKKKIYDMARHGYLLPAIEEGDGGEEDFIHSDMLVLVDRNSIIRGYYTGTDTAQVRMLVEDVNILLNQK